MKPNFPLLAFASALLLFTNCSKQNENLPFEITVASYNIRNARGLDGNVDLDRIAGVVNQSGAQIIGIQELDSATTRSNGLYVLGELAAKTNMHPTYAPAIDYAGGKYGIGVLSDSKPIATKQFPLPGAEEKRTLLIAEFDNCIIANTHLSLTEQDAFASIAIITDEAKKAEKPFLLMGDLNNTPNSPTIQQLQINGFKIVSDTSFTFPANKPDQCIDYIFLYNPSQSWRVTANSHIIPDTIASDHRPIYLQISLQKK